MSTNQIRQIIPIAARLAQTNYKTGTDESICKNDENGVCYVASNSDINIDLSGCIGSTGADSDETHCNRTCGQGGLVYDAFYIQKDA